MSITGLVIPDPAQRCLAEKRIIAPKTDNVLISRGGERYSIQGTAAPMVDAQGYSIGVVLVFKDVTDSRRKQKVIAHRATHDPLTGPGEPRRIRDAPGKGAAIGQGF